MISPPKNLGGTFGNDRTEINKESCLFFLCLMVKYIFQFAQSHPNFRLAELESVALLQNVALDPNDLLNHKQDSPFLILNLESDVEALALCDRCVLLRHVYEFYAQEKDFESLVSLVKCSTGEKGVLKVIEEKYSNARFKFLVKAYNHTIGSEESVKMINRFSFLPLRGGVSMKKAQVTFCIVSEYACASKVYEQPEILMAYFGRYVGSGRRDLIDKYNLKKRAYIGTTSMEAEISLVSANMALARKGALIYDPFVGTGSFLVTCSEFGAYTMGSELDGRKVRGNAGSGGKSIHCNSKQYGISNRVLDLFVFDVNTMPFSDRFCFFDAIITDPPYGVREGARKIASSSTTVNNADATTANINSGLDCNLECGEKKETIVTRFPETEPYHVEDVISDLVQMAAKRLIIGGRLVYWIPLTKDENGNFQGQKPPTHPALKIISDCEQEFSVWSRRLVVMEKICPFSEDMKPMQEIENPVQGTFRDRYFNLNNTR